MKVAVECFGIARRWCGGERIEIELHGGSTVQDAIDVLANGFPEFALHRRTVAVAIGDAVVDAQRALRAGDCLALIPPVSGG